MHELIKFKNFRNITTNRVEYDNSTLKNSLRNSKYDFCKGWELVNQMVQLQYNEIHSSFGCSITILKHTFKDKCLYSKLVEIISRARLKFIYQEVGRA